VGIKNSSPIPHIKSFAATSKHKSKNKPRRQESNSGKEDESDDEEEASMLAPQARISIEEKSKSDLKRPHIMYRYFGRRDTQLILILREWPR